MATTSLPATDSLQALQAYVWDMNKERGFDLKDPAKKMLLLTEEVGELAKAVRKVAGLKFTSTTKQTELTEEIADVLIVLLGLACRYRCIQCTRCQRTKEPRKDLEVNMSDANDTRNAALAAYQEYVRQVMGERGFDEERVSQKFMLLLEEAGEFAKAARQKANLAQAADAPVQDLTDAAADVFTILLDICNQLDIDLEQAFIAREHKNQARTWE